MDKRDSEKMNIAYLSLKFGPCKALIFGLFMVLGVTACGTLQIELATTPEQTTAPAGFVTPTPNFDQPQFATTAGTVFDDRLNLVGYTVNPQSSAPGLSLIHI